MASISSVLMEDGYLYIRFEGAAKNLQTGMERALDEHRNKIVSLCREHACRKILLDLTAIEGTIGMLEEHLAACVIIKRWPPGTHVAMVPAPNYFASGGKHLEQVANNRGAAIRLFGNLEEARTWLTTRNLSQDASA